MAKSMYVSEFALTGEDLLRPFSGQTQRSREGSEKLYDLCDVVVVFAVFGAGLRIEKVVAGNQFKDLSSTVSSV